MIKLPSRRKNDGFEPTQPLLNEPTKWRQLNTGEPRLITNLQIEMLSAIGVRPGSPYPPIWHKVIAARDIDSLWNLRVELMEVIAKVRGEAIASELLANISNHFNLKR